MLPMRSTFDTNKLMSDFLNINTTNRNEVKKVAPFYFLDNNFEKYKQLREFSRHSQGIPLEHIDSHHSKMAVVLKRHSSNSLAVLVFPWIKLHPIKTVLIPSLYLDSSHKNIFKFCGNKDSHILLYQECNAMIDIRRFVSLKKEKTFNLQDICKSLGIATDFSEIKVCLDATYLPDLGVVVMCLNQMLVSYKNEANFSVIYQFEQPKIRDRFVSVQYSHQHKILFAETIASVMMFDYGEEGVTATRVFQHPSLKNINGRIVGWDPAMSVIVSAQNDRMNKENIYVFQYWDSSEVKLLFWTKEKRTASAYYSPRMKKLLYIEEDMFGSKEVRSISVLDGLEKQEEVEDGEDADKLVEGEFIARLPDLVRKAPKYGPRLLNNTLFIRFMHL